MLTSKPLPGPDTIAGAAATAAINQIVSAFEREPGGSIPQVLADLDAAAAFITNYRTALAETSGEPPAWRPALVPAQARESANDFRFDQSSGHAGFWVEIGPDVLLHVYRSGSLVVAELTPSDTDEVVGGAVSFVTTIDEGLAREENARARHYRERLSVSGDFHERRGNGYQSGFSPDDYVVVAAGEVLYRGLALREALEQAARHDFFGAMFCRDAAGVMALRGSCGPVPENWRASGEEAPVLGATSAAVDDGVAIGEVCAAIMTAAPRWGGNMEGVEVLTEAQEIERRLRAGVEKATDASQGSRWIVCVKEDSCGTKRLSLGCVDDGPADVSDPAWVRFGGDRILADAGLRIVEVLGEPGADYALVELA